MSEEDFATAVRQLGLLDPLRTFLPGGHLQTGTWSVRLRLFFTMGIPATLAYYKEKLGFEWLGTWQDPPVYATWRDQQAITPLRRTAHSQSDKYRDELPDAYLMVEDADALYTEYAARGVEFTRGLPTCHGTARVRGEGLRWPSAGFGAKLCPSPVVLARRRTPLEHTARAAVMCVGTRVDGVVATWPGGRPYQIAGNSLVSHLRA
jgi:hypothetical protein